MRASAARIGTYLYRRNPVKVQSRNFSSSFHTRDQRSIEEEAGKKNRMDAETNLCWDCDNSGLPVLSILGRMKIVEMGGGQELLNMLDAAKDDRTRKEALKALVAIAQSEEAVGALHQAGAISVIRSTPDSVEDTEIEIYKLILLSRFRDLRNDVPF
ncbi:ARM repeat superfamily protein [Forsythia ovata]|uniref:ARM repeat superfamily protein n=1 Tax=Forsythia ovata TaxID=205694 RepID=A0ABD1WJI5_9LAMI